MNFIFQGLMILIILLQSHVIKAEKSQKAPVLTDYGPVYAIKDRDTPLPINYTYRAVFDVTTTASEPQDHSRRLESVARFLNMHALNGVTLENMQLAVVIHGKAVKDILNNTAYQKKFQVDNPNQQLIEQLHEKGVKFYVCGQTTAFLDYKRMDILPAIEVSLSAMTQLVILQDNGYALLP
ncbi:MAG: DsrE family protein [Gammaproteobacteria bacterium]|nr:DsrE family protein [Gammaproteobacteria bacterium]